MTLSEAVPRDERRPAMAGIVRSSGARLLAALVALVHFLVVGLVIAALVGTALAFVWLRAQAPLASAAERAVVAMAGAVTIVTLLFLALLWLERRLRRLERWARANAAPNRGGATNGPIEPKLGTVLASAAPAPLPPRRAPAQQAPGRPPKDRLHSDGHWAAFTRSSMTALRRSVRRRDLGGELAGPQHIWVVPWLHLCSRVAQRAQAIRRVCLRFVVVGEAGEAVVIECGGEVRDVRSEDQPLAYPNRLMPRGVAGREQQVDRTVAEHQSAFVDRCGVHKLDRAHAARARSWAKSHRLTDSPAL